MIVRWLWDRRLIDEYELEDDLNSHSVSLVLRRPEELPSMVPASRIEVEIDTRNRCSLCKQPVP